MITIVTRCVRALVCLGGALAFGACGSSDTTPATTDSGPDTGATETATDGAPGTCEGPFPAANGFIWEGSTGTMDFVDVISPQWQLTGRKTGSFPSFGASVQFKEKPTVSKVYKVIDYGTVTDSDSAFVYTAIFSSASSYINYNGVAGGCVNVTVVGTTITVSFKDLTVKSVNADAGTKLATATLTKDVP